MQSIRTITVTLVLLVLIVFIVFFLLKGEKKHNTKKDKSYIHLSKRGSVVFYTFLSLVFIFLIVMYIKWRIYLNA
ncbi:MAG: hypothetical protein IJ748_04685 [Bacteroidales bacterium]|nr:hypothetical protein [Bacteroidales bacterium]